MELGEVDGELGDGAEDELGEQGGAVGVEEAIQCPSNPIVVEQRRFICDEPELVGVEWGGPFAEGVDGFAVEHEVAHQHPEGEAGSEAQAPVVVRDVALEELGEAEPLEEVVDQGEGAEDLGVEGEPPRPWHDELLDVALACRTV